MFLYWATGPENSRREIGSVAGMGTTWFQAFVKGLGLGLGVCMTQQIWVKTSNVFGVESCWTRIEDFIDADIYPIMPSQNCINHN